MKLSYLTNKTIVARILDEISKSQTNKDWCILDSAVDMMTYFQELEFEILAEKCFISLKEDK